MKIINPKKKSDFVLLTWHEVSSRFEAVSELKLKLIDDFKEFVSSTPNFQVGYMEGRSTQQWIIARQDLDAMYESAKEDVEIILWCDNKVEVPKDERSRKRKSTYTPTEDCTLASKVSKDEERDQELLTIVDQLKKTF